MCCTCSLLAVRRHQVSMQRLSQPLFRAAGFLAPAVCSEIVVLNSPLASPHFPSTFHSIPSLTSLPPPTLSLQAHPKEVVALEEAVGGAREALPL